MSRDPQSQRNFGQRLLGYGAALLLLVTTAVSLQADDSVTLAPSMVGERVSVAKQLMKLAGRAPLVGERVIAADDWRDDVQLGVVQLQSPPAGTPITSKSVLAAWTFRKAAAGETLVSVPDLRSKSAAEAQQELAALKLKTLMPAVDPATQPAAKVVDQYPRPGEKVIAGSSVLLMLE